VGIGGGGLGTLCGGSDGLGLDGIGGNGAFLPGGGGGVSDGFSGKGDG